MAKSSAEFNLVIGATDKFTGPFSTFGSAMDKAGGKLKKLGGEYSKFKKNLDKRLGFSQTKAALNGLGQGFAKVGGEARKLFGTVARLGTLGGLASGGVLGGVYKLSKDFADAGAEAAAMAQELGLTAQQWQGMTYAAKLNGVEAGELQLSYVALNKSLIAAAKTGKGPAAEAFKKLGVGLKSLTEKGKLKNTDLLMTDLAEAFSKMEDGADKSALAAQIFGRAGVKLLPMLNKGAAGLEDLRREAERLGLVFDDDAVAAGAAFSTTLGGLGLQIKGLGYSIGRSFLPAAHGLAGMFGELADENRDLIAQKTDQWAKKFTAFLPRLKSGVQNFSRAIPAMLGRVNKFAKALGGWGNVGKIAAVVMSGPLIKSVFGLAGAFKTLGMAFMTTPLGFVLGLAGAFGAMLVQVGALEPLLNGISAGFGSMSGYLTEAFVGLAQGLGKAFGDIGDSLFKTNGEIDPEAWEKLGKAVGAFTGSALADLVDLLTKAVALFKALGDFLGSTAGQVVTGVDVSAMDQINKDREKLNKEIQAASAKPGGLSERDKINIAQRSQALDDREWDATHSKTASWLWGIGSAVNRRATVDFFSNAAEKMGSALGVAPGGAEAGRLAKPSAWQSAVSLGPNALGEGGLGGAVNAQKTEHTEIIKNEATLRFVLPPGFGLVQAAGGLPEGVKAVLPGSYTGTANSGG